MSENPARADVWGGGRRAMMIDDVGSRDLDDAIWVAAAPGGGWTVTVHIAAPALAIAKDSAMDRQARGRVESRYLPHRTIPMLGTGERLSTLSASAEREALSVNIAVDSAGRISGREVFRSVLPAGSCVRLPYAQVPEVLEDRDHALHGQLTCASELAQTLLAGRRCAGALAMYDLNRGFAVSEDGSIVTIPLKRRNIGYIIVAEMMIAANAEIAQWCVEQDLPILYRNHRTKMLTGTGEDLTAEIAATLHDPGLFEQLRSRINRTFGRATYSRLPSGHHGLRLQTYTHATSPLRRYADLVTQRIVLGHLAGESDVYTPAELDQIAEEINRFLEADRPRRNAVREELERRQTVSHVLEGEYDKLDQKQWRKMFDLIVKTAPAVGIETELNRRLAEKILVANDVAKLASAVEAWKPIQSRFFPKVREAAPELGPSVINGWAQLVGSAIRPEIEEHKHPDRPDNEALFAVRARSGETIGRWQLAASKKTATAQAMWELLDVLCGLKESIDELDPWHGYSPASVSAERSTKAAVTRQEWVRRPAPAEGLPDAVLGQLRALTSAKRGRAFDNPVGWLASFAEMNKLTPVSYLIESEGPPHAPIFACTAQFGGYECTVTGPVKNHSRVAAAAALLREVFEDLS